LLVMAWSPPALNAGIVWVSAPGDYATFNSNHTPDGTKKRPECLEAGSSAIAQTWRHRGIAGELSAECRGAQGRVPQEADAISRQFYGCCPNSPMTSA